MRRKTPSFQKQVTASSPEGHSFSLKREKSTRGRLHTAHSKSAPWLEVRHRMQNTEFGMNFHFKTRKAHNEQFQAVEMEKGSL
jgi:hypothetical protein